MEDLKKMKLAQMRGRLVRLTKAIRNQGGQTFEAGQTMRIEDKWGGLALRPLQGPGAISRVNYSYVELLPVETP